MKQYLDFSSDLNFWILLAFLFLIPFSIAACSLLLGLLVVPFIVSWVRGRLPALPGFFWCFVVFIVISLATTFFSIDFWTSLKGNKELLRFLLFPFCLLSLRTPRRVRLSLLVVLVSAVLSAALGVWQWAGRGIVLDRRLKGLTSHWMTYAGLLMLVFVFFAVYWLQSTPKRRQAGLVAPLLLIFAVIALSLTRSAWIGIAAALFLFLVFFRPRWMAIGVPLLALLLLMAPRPVQKRVFSIVDPNDPSNRDRIFMVYTGWHMFRDHVLAGVGTNNVGRLYPQYQHPSALQANPHLHNNFLQVLAERGIFAFIAFSAAWILLLVELGGKIRTGHGLRRRLAAAVLFVTVAFLVAGLFEYNFGDGEVRYLLIYFLALPFLDLCEDEYDHIEATGRNKLAIL